MTLVIAAGESLVDLTPGVTPDGAPALVPVLGGAPVNVAIAAGRLGAPAGFLGVLSADGFGRQLAGRFRAEGVALVNPETVDAPTTLAVVTLDDDGHASYTFYLDGTTGRQPLPSRVAIPHDAVLAICAGAVGLDDAPLGTALVELARSVAATTPVWLDPNVRPSAVADHRAYRRVVESVVEVATVVKASDEDLAFLRDGPGADPGLGVEVARDWAGRGPALVVLTRGGDGLVALRPDGGEIAVPAATSNVVDTVGAGDTVTGALLAWTATRGRADRAGLLALSDDEVAEALTFAATAAGVTCSRRGANPPTLADLDRPAP